MKCAAEFIAIKKEAIAKHEAELDAIRLERKARAVSFAESQVSITLEQLATKRELLQCYAKVILKTDEAGAYFYAIEKITNNSAKTISEEIDYSYFVKFLKEHCILCDELKNTTYYYVNGASCSVPTKELRIFIPAEGSERECGAAL